MKKHFYIVIGQHNTVYGCYDCLCKAATRAKELAGIVKGKTYRVLKAELEHTVQSV